MSHTSQPFESKSVTNKTPLSFTSLAGELRNRIYELLLVDEHPINPWCYSYAVNTLTTGLLHTNKAIYNEAVSVMYGRNCFDFTMVMAEELAGFFGKIGGKNSAYIHHINIDFPTLLHVDPEDITFEDDSFNILNIISDHCTHLRTITTSLSSTSSMENMFNRLENTKTEAKALELVDGHFRANGSIEKVILELYEDGPSQGLRKKMESYGWEISTTKYVEPEDWNRTFSDYGHDDYDHDDYYAGEDVDEYDIDNDSDFWRRAADD